MDLKVLLLALSSSSPLFAVILGRKAKRHPMFYYVVIATLTELITSTLKFGFNQNIKWAGNPFLALELLFFSLFFERIIQPKRKLLYWLAVVTLMIGFIWPSIDSFFEGFHRLGASLLCIIYTIMCLICYRRILSNQRHQFIEQSSSFWITNGIFIYAATTSVVFALPEILKSDVDFTNRVWSYFYVVINLMRYVLIGIGLRLYTKYGD